MSLPNNLRRTLMAAAALIAVMAANSPSVAQVTPEQQSAIRSNCRSDFMSKCSGVTPGGKDALNCLQKNVASLAPACKTAVSATLPAPAPAEAKPAQAAPPAPAPEQRTITRAPPPAAVPARPAQPKPQQAQKPATPPQQTVAPPTSLAAPAPPPATRTPNAPVVMTAVIGRACLRDLLLHCRHIKVGDGRKIACLMARGPKCLSEELLNPMNHL